MKVFRSQNAVTRVSKLSKLLLGLLAIIYIYGIYTLNTSHIVPEKYITLSIVTGAIILLTFYSLIYRKKMIHFLLPLLELILLITGVVAITLFGSTSSAVIHLLDKSQEQKGMSTLAYSVIAKKDKHILKQKSAETSIGIVAQDTSKSYLIKALGNDFIPKIREYPDIASITLALEDEEVHSAAILSSSVILVKENYSSFYDNTEVIDELHLNIPSQNVTQNTDITKPFIIYISGIDTYGEISTLSRSDVNMLAVVNPITHKILLVNTPRDYYLQLHGTTGLRDKLTHAGIYGITMSTATMEDLYAIKIDNYVRINFSSLQKVIDALGGVSVYSDQAFSSYVYSFVKGYNYLDSTKALEFARARYPFADGDKARGRNQQRVLEAVISKLASPRTAIDSKRILTSLDGSFQTNMPTNTITELIKRQLDGLYDWKTESIAVDGSNAQAPTYSIGPTLLYVMEPNQASIDIAKQKITSYLGY